MPKKITKSELRRDLLRVFKDFGAIPSYSFYREYSGKYARNTFVAAFGSWKRAIAEILPETAKRKTRKMDFRISNKQLTDDIVRVAKLVGHQPEIADYKKYGQFSNSVVRRRFGSWGKAIQSAGLKFRERKQNDFKYTKNQLTNDLRRIRAALNKIPSREDYKKHGICSPDTLRSYFDNKTFRKILNEVFSLSLPKFSENFTIYKSDEQLIIELQNLAKRLRHTPATTEAKKYLSVQKYIKRFGSWKAAITAANLPAITYRRKFKTKKKAE